MSIRLRSLRTERFQNGRRCVRAESSPAVEANVLGGTWKALLPPQAAGGQWSITARAGTKSVDAWSGRGTCESSWLAASGTQKWIYMDLLLFSFLHMFLFSYCSSETKEVDLIRTNLLYVSKKTHVIASEHGLIYHFQYLSLSYLWPLIPSQHRLYRNQVHRY